jgi:hypothetical protein
MKPILTYTARLGSPLSSLLLIASGTSGFHVSVVDSLASFAFASLRAYQFLNFARKRDHFESSTRSKYNIALRTVLPSASERSFATT